MSDDHDTDRDEPIDELIFTNEERKILALRIGRFGTKPPEWSDGAFAFALFSTFFDEGQERAIPLVPLFLRTNAPDKLKAASRRWVLDPFTSLRYSAQRASEAIAGVASGSFHVLVLRESDRVVTAKAVTESIGHEPSGEEVDNAKRAVASEVERLTKRIAKHVGVDSFMEEGLVPFAVSKARMGLILERIESKAEARKQATKASGNIDAIAIEDVADPVDAPESIDPAKAPDVHDPMEPEPGETKSFALDRELRVDAWTNRYAEADRNGLLELDAILFDTIREINGDGPKGIADKEERDARTRWEMRNDPSFAFRKGDPTNPGALWKRWVNPIDTEGFGFPFIGLLAEAAWLGIVRPKLERERDRLPAGLARVVASDQIIATMTRQLAIPELDDGTVRDERGKIIGSITLTTDATLDAVRRGLASFGTVAGNRLVRGLVHRAHDQRDAGIGDFRRVAFEGGEAALLDALSLGRNYGPTLREIAIAGASVQWNTTHGDGGGFWTWSSRRGSRKGPGEVAFVLGDPLLPGYVSGLARLPGAATPTARINRRFVPELRGEVPIPEGLDASKHGHVWTFHRMMIVELVDYAASLATEGFVTIPEARYLELARTAGLGKRDDVARVLHTFTNGDTKNPPIFARDGDGWTLADPHSKERDYIADCGRSRISGKERGKAAAKVRHEGAPKKRRQGKRANG